MARVYCKRSSVELTFQSLDDLREKVETQWVAMFKYADYTLHIQLPLAGTKKKYLVELTDLSSIKVEQELIIVVRLTTKRFSTIASHSGSAFGSIGCPYTDVHMVPRDKGATFVCCDEKVLPSELLDRAVSKLVANLEDRKTVMNLELASEYTMREFVSPVLVEVVLLTSQVWKSTAESTVDCNLSLACERIIVGKGAHGPVDYSILLDWVDFVLTEVKHHDMSMGIVQNLVQQAACKEFLANAVVPWSFVGKKRKQEFESTYGSISKLSSYGVATTGDAWVLCKYTPKGDNQSAAAVISKEIRIGIREAVLDETEIRHLLSCLVHILLTLMKEMQTEPQLKKFKDTLAEEGLGAKSILSRQATEGLQFESQMNENEGEDKEEQEEQEEQEEEE